MPVSRVAPLLLILALGGCGARDCVYDIAHRDCGAAPQASLIPQDDALCRSYGLVRGSLDYDRCRIAKRQVRLHARDESDYGFLRNPILPEVH